MLISINSFKNYCIVNSFLFSLGAFQYLSIYYITDLNFLNNFLFVFSVFLFRNYTLLYFISLGTKNKPNINNTLNIPLEDYRHEFHTNVITTTSVETMTHIFIKKHIIDMTFSRNIYYEIMYFIPLSFLFEAIFDFFHYFTHRLLHDKYLYKFAHKKHHKFKHPIAITTFYQDPVDLIITNSMPTILSILVTPQLTYSMFHFIVVYKNFIEISGHSGKILYPTTSFPQFMWLPKWLNIELYCEDHDTHHSVNNCNYSKRFSLWDKVFNTYNTPVSV
jgi:sterol desaturase/sphingolipid hydroxylase (fatty acid hydroxylase superfamily)